MLSRNSTYRFVLLVPIVWKLWAQIITQTESTYLLRRLEYVKCQVV